MKDFLLGWLYGADEITAIFGIGAAMFIIGIVVAMWGLQRAHRDERRCREEAK